MMILEDTANMQALIKSHLEQQVPIQHPKTKAYGKQKDRLCSHR